MRWILVLLLGLVGLLSETRAGILLYTANLVTLDVDRDGQGDFKLQYIQVHPFPVDRNDSFELTLLAGDMGLFYVNASSVIKTNGLTASVKPSLICETCTNNTEIGFRTNLSLIYGNGDSSSITFGGNVFSDGKGLVFGFSLVKPTGTHFGWARIQSSLGTDNFVELSNNFSTNYPPVITEVTVNPVPWAAIPLARPTPGGPRISFARQTNSVLRLTYPDWATRYVIRRRASPNGAVLETFSGGHEGLVATNGVFAVEVPANQESGFFELYLPAANR